MMKHTGVILRPDPMRTVVRPFSPEYPQAFAHGTDRAQAIVDRILSLDPDQLQEELRTVMVSLDERHRDVDAMMLRRFDDVARTLNDATGLSRDCRRLIGAYFSQEYSFEAAALFNPSAVLHPQHSATDAGAAAGTDEVRFLLSLRGIGEGHVSSVTFRAGAWNPRDGTVRMEPSSQTAVPPVIHGPDQGESVGGEVVLGCGGSRELSETVLFPVLPSQRQGIEDVRLVEFAKGEAPARYLGTYTAFDGRDARCEMLLTDDFSSFEMRPLTGAAAAYKGTALFPRRVDDRFLALGRQDSENIWLMRSDDLFHWEGGDVLVRPRFPWEFIQMGNCGSPIELDEGWLVLTHGVGTVRNYCMGACLLDRKDPSRLLARTPEPILEPDPADRDGYVPNVVYSCGALLSGRQLLVPYGVADNFATFATVAIDELLAAMR